MRNRKYKSIKEELLKKSREAIISAVQIYNNPSITFKSETYITLSIIGWTYLMHAYYRHCGVDYRYYKTQGARKKYDRTKHGAYKHWELERCLNDDRCPLDDDTKNNLRFLIGIRHEIEHQMTSQIDEYLSAKLQACAINFDYYITDLFGEKYKISENLSLAIQFSPLTADQESYLKDNPHITSNVKNFIVDFEDNLSEISLRSQHYAYRVIFTPVNVNRQGQADQVIEFIRADSELAQGIEKTYAVLKETEKPKYLPGQIVKQMQSLGYTKFTIYKHCELWKSKDAKNPKKHYGTVIAGTWYWYENWLKEVIKHCENNSNLYS